ncbi:hypothetical protein Q3G72_007053 [Acer saccharum]|nr:hypothetical protein Q3G72_007053 [Acer saccharum]
MCEAFNSVILNAHDKPVLTLMEMIRTYLMKRFVRKRAEVEKWNHEIGLKVFKFVEKAQTTMDKFDPARDPDDVDEDNHKSPSDADASDA